jgi:hypothetical protein
VHIFGDIIQIPSLKKHEPTMSSDDYSDQDVPDSNGSDLENSPSILKKNLMLMFQLYKMFQLVILHSGHS